VTIAARGGEYHHLLIFLKLNRVENLNQERFLNIGRHESKFLFQVVHGHLKIRICLDSVSNFFDVEVFRQEFTENLLLRVEFREG